MHKRGLSRWLVLPALVVVAAVAFAASAITSASAGKPTAGVELFATPTEVSFVPRPCLPGKLTVGMRNPSESPLYADMFIEPGAPLAVSRTVFSSYVPPGYQTTVPIDVTAARDTPPGDYQVLLRSGRAEYRVPVTVLPPPASAGANRAYGERATASSTHSSFSVCGAVDGNANSADWSTRTGWNDGTSRLFPDQYAVELAAPTTIGRIDLHTLNSTTYPAARYGLRDWDVQVRIGGEWQTVDEVRGNTAGLVSSTFPPVATDAIRIVALASNDGSYSRIVELEAFGG
jgi:hypothetical protein